jgi:hypothetical protein
MNKTNPPKGHFRQVEFSFTAEPEIYLRPSISEKVMCCSSVPEQRQHCSGDCFADHPPLWMRPLVPVHKKISSGGGKPPTEPKKPKTSDVSLRSRLNQGDFDERSNNIIHQEI